MATWVAGDYVVRYHVIGPAGRLEHEAAVAARLPAVALYPEVVAVGRDDGHDYLVTRRVASLPLHQAWPSMDHDERRSAIGQAAMALRGVHSASALDLVPPCLYRGAPVVRGQELVDRLLWLLDQAAGDAGLKRETGELIVSLAPILDDRPLVMAHGDFNVSQLLYDRGRITGLVDLEMSHADAADWDLWPFLESCAEPGREGFVDAPRWLREAYPEMWVHPLVEERLRLYELAYESIDLLGLPDQLERMWVTLNGQGRVGKLARHVLEGRAS
jgi:hypothetical protein